VAPPPCSCGLQVQSSLATGLTCHDRSWGWEPFHFLFAVGSDIFDSGTGDVINLDHNDEKDLEGGCEAGPLLLENCEYALEYHKALALVGCGDSTSGYSQSVHCQGFLQLEHQGDAGEGVYVFLQFDSCSVYLLAGATVIRGVSYD